MDKKFEREIDYDLIFDLYEVGRYNPRETHRVRQLLRRYFDGYCQENNLKDRSWPKLDRDQQNQFIFHTIRKPMEKRVSQSIHAMIERNLNTYAKTHLVDGLHEAKKHNITTSQLMVRYDITATSCQKEKQKAYNHLCDTLRTHNNKMPVPSYDEFVNNPLRPYDYIMSYESEQNDNQAQDYTSLETDYVMQILLKVVQDKLGLEIDFDILRNCIHTFMHPNVPELELFDKGGFPLEYDSSFGITETEFKEAKKNFLKYLECQNKLNTLDGLYTIKK